ncbi:MAG: hypothetical protein ACREQ9_07365 [Candidatus Binatia bacterium]
MRNFIYGLVFGALAMYFYTFHWHQVEFVKAYFDTWRDDAVRETSKYN